MTRRSSQPSDLLAFACKNLGVDLAEMRVHPSCGEVLRCRRVIAIALLREGTTVSEVADLLYVTEAVVRRWRSKTRKDESDSADILRTRYATNIR